MYTHWAHVGRGAAGLGAAMGIGRFAYTPILPLMTTQAALTPEAVGTLATANYIGYLAGALAGTASPRLARSTGAWRVSLVAVLFVSYWPRPRPPQGLVGRAMVATPARIPRRRRPADYRLLRRADPGSRSGATSSARRLFTRSARRGAGRRAVGDGRRSASVRWGSVAGNHASSSSAPNSGVSRVNSPIKARTAGLSSP